MATVEYHEIERWGWECPKCKNWQEEEDDPAYLGALTCDECGEEFEPVQG